MSEEEREERGEEGKTRNALLAPPAKRLNDMPLRPPTQPHMLVPIPRRDQCILDSVRRRSRDERKGVEHRDVTQEGLLGFGLGFGSGEGRGRGVGEGEAASSRRRSAARQREGRRELGKRTGKHPQTCLRRRSPPLRSPPVRSHASRAPSSSGPSNQEGTKRREACLRLLRRGRLRRERGRKRRRGGE